MKKTYLFHLLNFLPFLLSFLPCAVYYFLIRSAPPPPHPSVELIFFVSEGGFVDRLPCFRLPCSFPYFSLLLLFLFFNFSLVRQDLPQPSVFRAFWSLYLIPPLTRFRCSAISGCLSLTFEVNETEKVSGLGAHLEWEGGTKGKGKRIISVLI